MADKQTERIKLATTILQALLRNPNSDLRAILTDPSGIAVFVVRLADSVLKELDQND